MRWLFRIAGILVAVCVVVIVGLLLLPGERIARIAADQIRAQTGRDLTISGDVDITLWPVLGVNTGPVALSNADWAGSQPMFTADGLSIGIAAPDLLTGSIRVRQVVARRPHLQLATAADGRNNWDMAKPSGASVEASDGTPGETSPSTPVTIEHVELTGASLTYAAQGKPSVSIENFDLTLDWPRRDAPTDAHLVLRPNGDDVDVTARIRGLEALLAGQVTPVTAKINAPGGGILFDGRISSAGEAAGSASVETTDTARMLSALGLPGAKPPAGLGQAAQISANLTYTAGGRLSLRDLIAQLDSNAISGAADIRMSSPPYVTAQLTAGDLDLSGAASASGGGGGTAPAQAYTGWSKEPIDASGLSAINGEISFSAQSLDTGDLQTGPIAGTLGIDRSRAVLDISRVAVFDGSASGQLVANNRNGLSVGGRLQVSEIELEQALGDLADVRRLAGKARGNLEFLGVGQSMHAIMNSLSGKGAISAGPGVINGIDLDRLMKTGVGSGGTTVFNTLTASYTIRGGNLQNNDLLLTLKNFRADGKGWIGLGARDIDYLFTPVALRVNAGQGVAIPIRIQGPWADPRIKPDLSQLLDQELEVKKDELEQQAKEKAKEKLAEELGVDAENKDDLEEALKDKIEEEAKKGLLKLLGQN